MNKTSSTFRDREDIELEDVIAASFLIPSSSSHRQLTEIEEEEAERPEYPDGGWEAYSVVLGSFLGLVATFGTINSVGAVQTYVSLNQLANVPTSTVSWIFSIYMSLSFLVGVFVGPYFDAKGLLHLLVAGTLFLIVGYFTTAECKTVYQFILAFSICLGVGNGLAITPLISCLGHWFHRRIGNATSAATVGGLVGGIVIPLMLRLLYTKVGFKWAIRILGFFNCSLLAVLIWLCRARILEPQLERPRYSKSLFDISALRLLLFCVFTFAVFAVELALLSSITYVPSYASAHGMSELESYLLVTILNATGIAGRLIPGYFSDILGHFNVMILTIFGTAVTIFAIWLPFGHLREAMYVFSGLFGFFSALILALTPVCLLDTCPANRFGQRYGLMYFFVSLLNLCMIPAGGAIIGSGSDKEYSHFVTFVGVWAVVGLICWYGCRYVLVGRKLNVKI